MVQPVQHLRGTAAEWMANDSIILDGEIAFLVAANGDAIGMKLGDGGAYSATPFVALAAAPPPAPEVPAGGGTAYTISLATGSGFLIKNGLIMRAGAGLDYTRSGANLALAVALDVTTPADWLLWIWL